MLPEYDGKHYMIYVLIYHSEEPERQTQSFDESNLQNVTGPMCLFCKTEWRADLGVHCPGQQFL